MLDDREGKQEVEEGQMMFETIVPFDSIADHSTVAQLALPEGCLLVSVHRSGRDIIPQGKTELQAGDYLTILIKREDELLAREELRKVLTEK